MSIAIASVRPGPRPDGAEPRPRRRLLRRVLLWTGAAVFTFVVVVGSWVAIGIYRIDHAVHHIAVPASLLAKGKNDLLAVIKGPNHSEQVFVFHATGGRTKVLQIPPALALPERDGTTVPLHSFSLRAPDSMISGLGRLGIPVTHYVGVDLHMVSPDSSLGRLATGKLSITSMISDPTGTTSLLEQAASHIFLGPGTPVSAVLSLMNVPTAHPVSVPTATDGRGHVVLAATFPDVLRGFL